MTSEIPSPCINRCMLDENDVCESCFRHMDEIKYWKELDYNEKKQVLQNIQIRKSRQENQ